MNEPIRITSLATVGEILQERPAINRLILKQVGESLWETTKLDGDRPNDLHQVAERSGGKFAYERNHKRGFEALSGYVIDSDEQIKVIYRLSENQRAEACSGVRLVSEPRNASERQALSRL